MKEMFIFFSSSFIDISSLLAYSLSDGTVGVYNEGVRLWRIKVGIRIENIFFEEFNCMILNFTVPVQIKRFIHVLF